MSSLNNKPVFQTLRYDPNVCVHRQLKIEGIKNLAVNVQTS